jgi:hypothetical protein
MRKFTWFPTKTFSGKWVWLIWVEYLTPLEFQLKLGETMVEMMKNYNDPNFKAKEYLQNSLGISCKDGD